MGIVAASSLAAYIFAQGKPTVNQGSTEPRLSISTAQLTTTAAPFEGESALLAEPQPLASYRGPEHNPERAALLREALVTRKVQQLNATDESSPDDDDAPNQPGASLQRSASNQPGALQNSAAESRRVTNVPEQKQDPALEGYVQHLLRTRVVPLLERCYEALTQRHPEALGNVGLNFSILGERSLGGVVIDMDLTATDTLEDPLFRTCMTDSMYALIVEAPPGATGSVSVEQIFELSP